MKYRQFDPAKDKGKPLFEIRTKDIEGGSATTIVPAQVDFKLAAQTPWFYVVEDK